MHTKPVKSGNIFTRRLKQSRTTFKVLQQLQCLFDIQKKVLSSLIGS